MTDNRRGFGSDNHAGVHAAVLQALASANVGHVYSYGDDPYTEQAVARFREVFALNTHGFP